MSLGKKKVLSVFDSACSACSLVLLLGIGAQDPSQSFISDIWALQPVLLSVKKMHSFMLTPLVQVSGSISMVCFEKSTNYCPGGRMQIGQRPAAPCCVRVSRVDIGQVSQRIVELRGAILHMACTH